MPLLTSLTLTLTLALGQRIAITHDGNHNDPDDIGAVAMMEALIWKAGLQDRVVHIDHSNHIGGNTPWMHEAMITSATRGLGLFGIEPQKVHDAFLAQGAAIGSLRNAIESSSAWNQLIIVQAGPWELMARAFDVADPGTHQFVHIVSHSQWNDDYLGAFGHRNKVWFYDQYSAGQAFDGVTPPANTKILDQNWQGWKLPLSSWAWMDGFTPETKFVYDRTAASGSAAGDMSDAGMLYWLITGHQTAPMAEVKTFFGFGT